MVRLLSFFTAIILFLQSGGFIPFFIGGQMMHYAKMQDEIQHLKSLTTETLVISSEEFTACRYGRSEIIRGGKLYDIVSATTSGDKMVLELIRDEGESDYIDRLVSMLDQNATSPVMKELLKKIFFCQYNFRIAVKIWLPGFSTGTFPVYTGRIINALLESVFLPPEF